MRNIFFQYLKWQFFEQPKKIIQAWENFLSFDLYYFSIPILLKTLFAPWRRYSWSYGRGFNPSRYLQVFISNTFSRILGFTFRLLLIIIGIFTEIFIMLAGGLILIAWLVLPFAIIYLLALGIILSTVLCIPSLPNFPHPIN